MSDCLVTTLKESVSDDSLLKIDEFLIPFKSNIVAKINITPAEVTIKGDGYFTNQAGNANYGKTHEFPVGDNSYAYLSPGNYALLVKSKYIINVFNIAQGAIGNTPESFYVNLEDISYSSPTAGQIQIITTAGTATYGDIDKLLERNKVANYNISLSLSNVDAITGNINKIGSAVDTFYASRCNLTGDLSSLADKNALVNIDLRASKVTGNISSLATHNRNVIVLDETNITGNLSALSSMTTLTNLQIGSTAITGNISSLASLTNLTTLNVSDTAITGDTSSLANLTSLTTFNYTNTAITGTWPLA